MAFYEEPTMKPGVGEPAMGYPAPFPGPASSAPPSNPYLQPEQPLSLQAAPNSGKWTSGLCGCCSDCSSCCGACWCPCVLVGRVANIVDRGATSAFKGGAIFCLVPGLGFLYSCLNRTKLRHKYGLPEEPCVDICTECCCTCCSIAQTYRELKNRGVDPAFGYEMVQHIYDQPPVSQNMQRSW